MSQPCLPIPHHHPKRKRQRNASKDDGTNKNSASTPTDATFDNIEEMDATEYLFRVVQQAKGLPDVFVAQEEALIHQEFDPNFVPIDGSAASLSYLLSRRTQLMPPPSIHHLPKDCKRWTEQSTANFEGLRHYLKTCKEEGIGGKKTKRLAFPGMKDQEGWLAFCLGPNWNDEGTSDTNMVDSETTTSDSTTTDDSVPLWKRNIPEKGHDPLVRIILQIDQVLLRRVLSHVGHFLCNDLDDKIPKNEERHSHALKWMYSLLARLEFPIHRDDAAVLYQLLKALTRARACLVLPINDCEKLRNRLAQWNLLIIIIGIFFEQGGGASNLMECVS